MSDQIQRLDRSLLERSRLVLVHYTVVTVLPLVITVLLFVYFDSNSAEFQKQSLGIKFGGPIAAYAGLVLVLKSVLDTTFGHSEKKTSIARRLC